MKGLFIGTTLALAAMNGALAPLVGLGAVGYMGYKLLTSASGTAEESLEQICFDCGESVEPSYVGRYGLVYRCSCGRRWVAEF